MSQGIPVSEWAGTIYSDKKRYFSPHAGVKNAKRRIKIYGNPLFTGSENPFPALKLWRESAEAGSARKARRKLGEKARVEKDRSNEERGIKLTLRPSSGYSRKWKVESFPKMARSKFLHSGPPIKFSITETDNFRIVEWDNCRIIKPIEVAGQPH